MAALSAKFGGLSALFCQRFANAVVVSSPPSSVGAVAPFATVSAEPTKRPLNAYIRFSVATRPSMKAQNPKASMQEVTRLIGEKWAVVPETEKAPLLAAAASELELWKEKVAAAAAGTDEKTLQETKLKAREDRAEKAHKKELIKQRKLLASLGKPKLSPSGYQVYLKTHYESEKLRLGANTKASDIMKVIAEQWNGLADEAKEPYQVKADALKAEYNAALEAWEKRIDAEGAGREDVDKVSKRLKQIRKRRRNIGKESEALEAEGKN